MRSEISRCFRRNCVNVSFSATNTQAEYVDDGSTNNGGAPSNGRPRLRGDSVGGNSIEAFESGEGKEYDEDGSFIDQYGLEQRSHSKVSTPGSIEMKDMVSAQTRLLTNSGQDAV